MTDFLRLLSEKSLTVGIYGLGYVGIPLAHRISNVGYRVVGFDIVPERVDELNAGEARLRF